MHVQCCQYAVTCGQATGADCVLFPIGANDDMAHSQNEKIDVSNYMNGMKCLALYLDELSTLPENPIEPADQKGKSTRAPTFPIVLGGASGVRRARCDLVVIVWIVRAHIQRPLNLWILAFH